MYTQFVYLKKSEKRLVITPQEQTGSDYWLLIKNTCSDFKVGLDTAKSFCAGYLVGNQGLQVKNDFAEFQF